jgi:hypothetical protein
MAKSLATVNQSLNWVEAQGLVYNSAALLTEDLSTIRSALPTAEHTQEFYEARYYEMSTADRNMVRKSGQMAETGWWDPATNSLTSTPTHARGIRLVQMWFEQGGLCAYTRLPVALLDTQVEHVVPGGGDHPTNWLLVKANVNMNRKRATMAEFVARWTEKVKVGQKQFEADYAANEASNAANRNRKQLILAMSEAELRQFTPATSKEWEYVHRNVGMSSLQQKRLLKNGEVRAGGSQGNYKEVLNTCALEYLHGDKTLARSIFDDARAACVRYINGEIQNTTYAGLLSDLIESSEHAPVGFDRVKFIARLARMTYTHPHLAS